MMLWMASGMVVATIDVYEQLPYLIIKIIISRCRLMLFFAIIVTMGDGIIETMMLFA